VQLSLYCQSVTFVVARFNFNKVSLSVSFVEIRLQMTNLCCFSQDNPHLRWRPRW